MLNYVSDIILSHLEPLNKPSPPTRFPKIHLDIPLALSFFQHCMVLFSPWRFNETPLLGGIICKAVHRLREAFCFLDDQFHAQANFRTARQERCRGRGVGDGSGAALT